MIARTAKPAQQVNIKLPEWNTADRQDHAELAGFSFDDDPASRQLAQRLTRTNQIIFHELSSGLEIVTRSTVGSIRLGRLSLTIQPKMDGLPLMNMLRFAYGLRDLEIFDKQGFSSRPLAFQDLLILQLIVEVEELLARGLQRRYQRKDASLISPQGRLDFQQFTRQGGLLNGTLPCNYYHRLENNLHNQVLLSGLLLAAQITTDLILRSRTRRLAGLLADTVTAIALNHQVLRRVERESNRLTEAYNPAIKLVALLLGEAGSDLDEPTEPVRLQGFLFDMNHFFQALLSRLLNDYLEGYEVEDEHQLKGFLAYVPGFELPNSHDPLPRPDFAIFKKGKLISLFDAKYRDMWRERLPREMLYQLIVYALSQQNNRTATILYPSMDETAREAKIQINEPVHGTSSGFVVLRPVPMNTLERYVRDKDSVSLKKFAHQLIIGPKASA